MKGHSLGLVLAASSTIAAALCADAQATGTSSEIELLVPTTSAQGSLGVDSPWLQEAGTVRLSTLLQYERDPLVLYELGDESGTVIHNRQALALGVSVDLGGGASARLALPAALQWGSQVPELAADGLVVGDARVGLRLVPSARGKLAIGGRADLVIPTGSRDAWLSETRPRLAAGLLAGLRGDSLAATLDLGFLARGSQDTERNLVIGNELTGGLGLRYLAWPDHAAITGSLLARAGVADLAHSGGTVPVEAITGLSLWPRRNLQLDLGLGKGLTAGYGTTELRVLAGLMWTREPPPPVPPSLPVIHLAELSDDAAPARPDPVPVEDQSWAVDELARVEEERIVIRQPIRFAYATDRILPASKPTLASVASLLAQHSSIGHLVIEGHASDEGSFRYNYDLSILRAQAVWEALLSHGVSSERISFRGMGEVVPTTQGSDEDSLASNRRVEFHIVWRRSPDDPTPLPTGPARLPWSGESIDVISPPQPQPQPQPDGPDAADPATDDDVHIPTLNPAAGGSP